MPNPLTFVMLLSAGLTVSEFLHDLHNITYVGQFY
jgi:hypothetical protein